MTRLVACDIDGTLLDGSTAIAPAVFTQIRRLSRLGVYFCPASGRQYSSPVSYTHLTLPTIA